MRKLHYVELVFIVLLALTASAKTYRWRGRGDGVHWSDMRNWVDYANSQAVTNLESGLETTLYFYTDVEDADNPAVYAFDTINDLGPDFRMGNLHVGGYARTFRVSGDPIYTGKLLDDVNYYPSTVFTFDCDVYACGTNSDKICCNSFSCKAGHIRYFNGLVSHAADLTDADVGIGGGAFDRTTGASGTYIEYSGGGTNVFNGSYRFIGNNSNYMYANSQDKFSGGTAIMNCDCVESWFNYCSGVHFIIGPKGSVRKVHASCCDFWQLCTVDIYGKLFTNQAIPGQAGGTTTFNVFEGGLFDVATSFRIANNQPTIINIDGGVMVWRHQGYQLGDNSYAVVNVKRGRLYAGVNGGDPLKIGHQGKAYAASGTAGAADEKRVTVNFDGGETICRNLNDSTANEAIAERNRDTCFNGGILRLTGAGDVYNYSSGFTTDALKATTKAYLRAGGLKLDTQTYAVNWNKRLEVREGDSAGPVVKYGAGTLNVAADMTAARQAFVTGGVFSVNAAANWTGAVTLAPGTTLALAEGTELALDGLASDNGVVRLADGQKLVLSTVPAVAAGRGLVFDVDTATDGERTLIASDVAMDAALLDQCAVLAPTSGKSATFSLAEDGKALVLTIAAGTAPSPASTLYDLTQWVDPAPSTIGTDVAAEYVNSDSSPMVLDESVTTYGDVPFTLKGGSFELKDDFFFDSSYGWFSIRNAGSSPLKVAVTNDADIIAGTLLVGGTGDSSWQSSVSNKATIVCQTGGKVTIRATGSGDEKDARGYNVMSGGCAYFGPYYTSAAADLRLAPQVWDLAGGVFTMFPHTSLNLNGRSEFVVSGGKADLARVYSGQHNYAGAFAVGNQNGQVAVRVKDGELAVREQFSWISTSESGRYTEFSLTGGKATLPATTRTQGRIANRHRGEAAMLLDGGELTLSGKAAHGESSVDDYFGGLDSLFVGEGGVTIVNAGPAVVSNRVMGAMSGAGTLTKKGAGALELALPANVLGGLDVHEGSLKAALATAPEGKTPTGLIAWWDFNGEGDECLRDKSGHGFDLSQINYKNRDDGYVQFVEDELTRPGRGKAARWNGHYESLKAAAVQGAESYEYTICMWIYLDNKTTLSSHIMFFSNRIDPEITGHIGGTEIGYKDLNVPAGIGGQRTAGVTLTEETGISTDYVGAIPTKQWMMVALSAGIGGEYAYYNGELVTNVTSHCGILLTSGRVFTLGQGIATSEFANKGAMMDDVMIFNRRLSSDEIKALYDAQCAPETLAVPAVAVAAGATWDMNGASNKVTSVTGGGSILNGTVEIAESIACEGQSLHIAKPVIASATGTLDFGVAADVRMPRGVPYELFAFDEMSAESAANLAQWTIAGAGSDMGRLRARVYVENGKVYGYMPPIGITVTFR